MNSILDPDGLDKLVKKFLADCEEADERIRRQLKNQTIDPLLPAVEFAVDGVDSWLVSATSYKTRKAREMLIGDLREDLFDLLPDWEVKPREQGQPDLVCHSKKIIVELKSRWDTVKGSDLKGIYDNLLRNVNGEYRGYTAIYAYWLNKSRGQMFQPETFTPADNQTGQRRPSDPRILHADGAVIWAIAADPEQGLAPPYSNPSAILDVYQQVIDSISKNSSGSISSAKIHELRHLARRNFDRTLEP